MYGREAETQSNKALRKLTQVQLAVTEICGRARNSYSKGVLKKDFKDGLLEMEETAADVELDASGKLLPSTSTYQADAASMSAVGMFVTSLSCIKCCICSSAGMKSAAFLGVHVPEHVLSN